MQLAVSRLFVLWVHLPSDTITLMCLLALPISRDFFLLMLPREPHLITKTIALKRKPYLEIHTR
jgi:hypothetical protein